MSLEEIVREGLADIAAAIREGNASRAGAELSTPFTSDDNAIPKKQEKQETEEPIETAEEPSKPLTFDDVKEAFLEYIKVHGRDKAVAYLAAQGVKGKLSDDPPPPEKYQSFVDGMR